MERDVEYDYFFGGINVNWILDSAAIRVYSDNNDDTRFEDISIPLQDAGQIGKLSAGLPVLL